MENKKIIRNWKVVANNLNSLAAFEMYKTRTVNGQSYSIVGIRKDNNYFSKIYQSNVDSLVSESFKVDQILSNTWQILVPDNEKEQLLDNMREIFKDEDFSGLSYSRIDTMSIDELFRALIERMNNLDDKNKYRIAKHIIENKIYKKL